MLRLTTLTAIALLLATPALADPPAGNTNCNGNGSCGSTTTHNTTNAPVANGGQGGTGIGVGVGIGKGGNATSGASASSSSGASSNQHQGQVQVQGQDQDQAVTWINPRAPVSTAQAAALATSPEACMGSSSIGGQGVGFGLSIGSTWENEDCKLRKGAGLLFAMGAKGAAKEMLCGHETYRAAFLAAGEPCTADKPPAPPPVPVATKSAPEILGMSPLVP
jgi:hypothetical protein